MKDGRGYVSVAEYTPIDYTVREKLLQNTENSNNTWQKHGEPNLWSKFADHWTNTRTTSWIWKQRTVFERLFYLHAKKSIQNNVTPPPPIKSNRYTKRSEIMY